MSSTARSSREIEGKGWPIRELLAEPDARQRLYQNLAEQIWSPERLAEEASS